MRDRGQTINHARLRIFQKLTEFRRGTMNVETGQIPDNDVCNHGPASWSRNAAKSTRSTSPSGSE
jgi:hypothetical protein